MKIRLLATLISITLLSGCAQLGGTYFKRSYISIADNKNNETVGTILVWEADTSAAILFKDSQACMQTALAVKTANIKAEAKLSDAILNLSKTAQSIADNPDSTGNDQALLDVAGSIEEAASMLTTTTERTAFLNMGMFYICQISANDSITPQQTDKLIDQLIKSSAGIKKL